MKILIAYAGKTGGSRSMCELLASLLPRQEVVLFDIVNDKTHPVLGDTSPKALERSMTLPVALFKIFATSVISTINVL